MAGSDQKKCMQIEYKEIMYLQLANYQFLDV